MSTDGFVWLPTDDDTNVSIENENVSPDDEHGAQLTLMEKKMTKTHCLSNICFIHIICLATWLEVAPFDKILDLLVSSWRLLP